MASSPFRPFWSLCPGDWQELYGDLKGRNRASASPESSDPPGVGVLSRKNWGFGETAMGISKPRVENILQIRFWDSRSLHENLFVNFWVGKSLFQTADMLLILFLQP